MGIFNFLNKNNSNSDGKNTSSIKNNTEKKDELLNLRKEKFEKLCLEKKEVEKSRIAVVMDFSASMKYFYTNDIVQEILERLFPIALNLDNDGILDFWLFANDCQRIKSVNKKNYHNFIKEQIWGKFSMGGTSYAPVMKDVLEKYTKEEPSKVPTLVIFITDGENDDRKQCEKLLKSCSGENIFWQFIGIGSSEFKFLKKLDDITDRILDNADFFSCNDIEEISDKELYLRLMTEYPIWLKEAKNKNIV